MKRNSPPRSIGCCDLNDIDRCKLLNTRQVAIGGSRQKEAPICCQGQVIDLVPVPRAQKLAVHAVLILRTIQDQA